MNIKVVDEGASDCRHYFFFVFGRNKHLACEERRKMNNASFRNGR
jgi:hypothetical protein